MGFFEKFKAGFIRFMQGRNGPDQLGSAAIWTALVLCLLSMFTGWAVLSALCLVLQSLQSSNGSVKLAKWPLASHTEGFIKISASTS